MATLTAAAPRYTQVAVRPHSPAGELHRAARAAAFPTKRGRNLKRYSGKVIERLTFTNIYLGGAGRWEPSDIEKIDWALAAAMSDVRLNNVLAQYYGGRRPTSVFRPSRVLDGPLPHRVFRRTIEGFVAALESSHALSGFPLESTVFNFMLPKGVLLSERQAPARHERREADEDDERKPRFNPALGEHDAIDSLEGLGGYHGSIHPKHGSKRGTVYYAVGVYAEGKNGIVAFAQPWKSICATFYHELCEARTDPDIEDAIKAGDTPRGDDFLGWYSPRGGEIGDIPMDEAGAHLGKVMKEVKLTNSTRRVPVQLMWSNAVGKPEGPIAARRHPA
jgi:hypothetical protein